MDKSKYGSGKESSGKYGAKNEHASKPGYRYVERDTEYRPPALSGSTAVRQASGSRQSAGGSTTRGLTTFSPGAKNQEPVGGGCGVSGSRTSGRASGPGVRQSTSCATVRTGRPGPGQNGGRTSNNSSSRQSAATRTATQTLSRALVPTSGHGASRTSGHSTSQAIVPVSSRAIAPRSSRDSAGSTGDNHAEDGLRHVVRRGTSQNSGRTVVEEVYRASKTTQTVEVRRTVLDPLQSMNSGRGMETLRGRYLK
ncbi:hypothetical protein SPI_09391 [Niveomyces insectorum RCEF 264]|uniref:Uncharacterized protein n=1 Tax=Niveomyces insectorum RCEF 264 TaxID=1081102 RepID=A0A167LSY6_9HYPO|nr:hypothetical protein SPI_09391 [Niveomyces insectorum RCEF 264]